MGEGSRYASGINPAGFTERGEGRFEGIGVGVQPIEEGTFAKDTDVGILGGVDMGVYTFKRWLVGGLGAAGFTDSAGKTDLNVKE